MTIETHPVESAFDPQMWTGRAEGYGALGWVSASGPLQATVEAAHLKGGETVLDIGTGSQAVLEALKKKLGPEGRVFGFDVSLKMLTIGDPGENNVFVANVNRIPLLSGIVDVATARMVFHHLRDFEPPLAEVGRILKPHGRLVIGEYIAPDNAVLAFEREVFNIKEPGRHLWTPEGLIQDVQNSWKFGQVALGRGAVMRQYSVRDWMGKSGLPQKTQDAVLAKYLQAPPEIVEKMKVTFTDEGDALVDRPFTYVVAHKQ